MDTLRCVTIQFDGFSLKKQFLLSFSCQLLNCFCVMCGLVFRLSSLYVKVYMLKDLIYFCILKPFFTIIFAVFSK